MTRDEIQNLKDICYELSGHINRWFFGPDNVHPAQQKEYDQYQQMILVGLQTLNGLEEER